MPQNNSIKNESLEDLSLFAHLQKEFQFSKDQFSFENEPALNDFENQIINKHESQGEVYQSKLSSLDQMNQSFIYKNLEEISFENFHDNDFGSVQSFIPEEDKDLDQGPIRSILPISSQSLPQDQFQPESPRNNISEVHYVLAQFLQLQITEEKKFCKNFLQKLSKIVYLEIEKNKDQLSQTAKQLLETRKQSKKQINIKQFNQFVQNPQIRPLFASLLRTRKILREVQISRKQDPQNRREVKKMLNTLTHGFIHKEIKRLR